jgi:ketosteroid isomerase-like protein
MHKTMVPFLSLLALLFMCVPQIAAASNKALGEKIVALEKQGWEAIKKKDWNALGSLMTDDFMEVSEMGIRGKSEALEDLKANFILTEYAMEQIKVLELSKDAALLAYQLSQKGSYKGQGLPAKMNCSAAYVRRGGKWLNASFQETMAK